MKDKTYIEEIQKTIELFQSQQANHIDDESSFSELLSALQNCKVRVYGIALEPALHFEHAKKVCSVLREQFPVENTRFGFGLETDGKIGTTIFVTGEGAVAGGNELLNVKSAYQSMVKLLALI